MEWGGQMQVTVLDTTIVYANEADSVGKLMQEIGEILAERKLFIKYITIDGREVYNDFENELLDQLVQVEDVRVFGQTHEEATEEVYLSMSSYLERVLPQVQLLYTGLYQGADSNEWDRLTDLFDGMQWLYETCSVLAADWKNSPWNQRFNAYVQLIDAMVLELVPAMENIDAVSLADILKYELFPAYQGLQREVQLIIDEKVVKPDVN